ncbi:hypothetical protein [Pedobacter immunditicola]|uniref:hypothetical protein n=1 Tax=Pedobacter immunditicola TaxID=3133440 RepID=UPI00309EF89D
MENPQYTNKISLVIERTSNGLDYDYISPGLNKQELGKLHISFDETNEVGQFNQGFCYSIQRTERYLVYSIINTSHKDSAKRNGFYAVRLIVNQNEFIENVFVNLGKVARPYVNHVNTNNFNNQNYDAILSEIVKDVKKKHWITPKIDLEKVVYYQFINLNEGQNALFNNLKLSYAKKVYFLNDKSAQSDGIARQFGFQPLSTFWDKIKEIQFSNPHRQHLILNVNTEPFSVSTEQFVLVCRTLDEVKYKIAHERQSITVGPSEKEVVIQKPLVPLQNFKTSNQSGQHNKRSNNLILPWVLGIALGIAGGYFGRPYMDDVIGVNVPMIQYVEGFNARDQNKFNIQIDTNFKDVVHLISKERQLSDYVFKYDGKSKNWNYFISRDKKTIKKLTLKDVDSLLKDDDQLIDAFKKELRDVISTPIPVENHSKSKDKNELRDEKSTSTSSAISTKNTAVEKIGAKNPTPNKNGDKEKTTKPMTKAKSETPAKEIDTTKLNTTK